MWWDRQLTAVPNIEEIRKHARILVIDDHVLPAMKSFERDGYHFERWPEVRNLSQLTDGHYHLILLDIQGVGLNESPELQGLGILKHIKHLNPAQLVILYSSQPQKISNREYLVQADAVLDKGVSYVDYKEAVDELLLRRAQPGYLVGAMNRELGDQAIRVPRAVGMASRALRTGNSSRIERYLRGHIPNAQQVDRIVAILSIGVSTYGIVSG